MNGPQIIGDPRVQAAMLEQQQQLRQMQVNEFVLATARELDVPMVLEPLAMATSEVEVRPVLAQYAEKAQMAALVLAAQFKMVQLKPLPQPSAGG